MLLLHTVWSLLSEHCQGHCWLCRGEILTLELQISESSRSSQTKGRLWGIYGDLTFPELLKRSSIFTMLINCVCLGWQGRLWSSSFPFTFFCTSPNPGLQIQSHFDGSQFGCHDVKLNNTLIPHYNYCKQFHCLRGALQGYALANAASVTVHHMNILFTCCVCVCLKELWHF